MKIKIYVSIFELRKEGTRILRQRQRANSLVEQFNEYFYINLSRGAGYTNIKDDTGSERSIYYSVYGNVNAPDSDSTHGIVVGKGTNPVTISDYKLQSKIIHGTGVDNLQYSTTSFISPTTVGNYNSWKVSRTFFNASGSSITINEIGLMFRHQGAYYYYLEERTIITPYPVANGAGCAVQYEFRI